VLPADQRFRAVDLAVHEANVRLEVEDEFVAVERREKCIFHGSFGVGRAAVQALRVRVVRVSREALDHGKFFGARVAGHNSIESR
jgi:hypothetical protein